MAHLYVLQSGFVTGNTSRLVKTPESEETPLDSLLAVNLQTSDTDNFYDEGVESLFQQWRKDNKLMARFEFREMVLLSAYRVFSKNESVSIAPWLVDQLLQPEVGYLHRKFLKETFASVLNKESRSMETYTYFRLLHPSGPGNKPQVQNDCPDELLYEFVKRGQSTLITDFVREWTPNMHGFCDLLNTLHVIYGRRSDGIRPPPVFHT